MAFPNRIKPARGAARIDWRNPTTRGLVHYFLFNEGAGAGGTDLVNGSPWAMVNGETWTANEIGPAPLLDGTDDYLSLTMPGIVALEGTVDFWIKPTSVSSDTRLLGNNTSATFNFRLNSTAFEFYPNAGGGAWAVLGTSSDIAAGKLVHLAASFTDNTGSLQHNAQGYINGVAGTAVTADIDTGLSAESILYFGRRFNDAFGNRYAGEVAQLRFWNRVLSPDEVLGLYREPFGMLRRSRFFAVPGGAVQYNQSVAGTLPSAGTLVKRTARALTGAVTPTGALVKRTARSLAGSLTPSGALTAARTIVASIAGTLGSSGALTRRTNTSKAGAVTPTGSLSRQTGKGLAGSLTPSGTLATIRAALVSIGGTLGIAGSLTRQTARSLAGTLASAGALAKQARKTFAGSLTPSGALSTVRVVIVALAGALTFAGALTRSVSKGLAGALAPSGALNKRIAVALAGVLSIAGTVAGTIGGATSAIVGRFKGMFRGMRKGMK